jgi:sugar lactone lactonase YvrE
MKTWTRSLGAVALFLALWPFAVAHAAVGAITTVATFDPAKGQLPENLVFDHRGNLFLNLAASGEIRKFAPDGTQSDLAVLRPGTGAANFLAGLAVDGQDNVYAALASHNVAGSDTHGIWRIRPDGTKELFAALDPQGVPNQPLFDTRGNLLVSDSFLGTIWSIARDGTVHTWLSDPLLQGDTSTCNFPLPFGVNGMVFDSHWNLLVVNTSKALLLRIPVKPDGSAGSPSVVASGCANLEGADGITIDNQDNVYAADNIQNRVVRVSPSGSVETIASAKDGLDTPSGVGFGARGEPATLYITNFAYFTVLGGGTAHPSLMKVDVGVPGAPLIGVPQITRSSPLALSASFTVSFASTTPGQGEVLFGVGPGCTGLVEVATQDRGAGTTSHTVTVTGNELPGTIGNIGLIPGATYSCELVTVTRSGTEVNNNGGSCYQVTIPTE